MTSFILLLHYKADTSMRRIVWRGADCFALRLSYLRKNLCKADISIKRTLFLPPWCPLYRDFAVLSFEKCLGKLSGFKSQITGNVSFLVNTISTVLFKHKSDNYYDLHLVNPLRWLVSTSKLLNKSHLIINFVKNKLPHKYFLKILRLFMEASTYCNMALILSRY